ncbi:Carboxylesterase NlhH [Candidatus Rubidus massiliensis]|nr:MAG: hypothetical protein BGO10_04095 [Chlamydia sp. 32-24]CDZ80818.1 Carboxylesterase NlhH [Candidatus Rubidus massiliensis]
MNSLCSSNKLLLNPQFKAFIDEFRAISDASKQLSLEEGRKLSSQFFLSQAIYEDVESIQDLVILGRDENNIPLRIYNPCPSETLPTIVYFHRGGWVFGSVNDADPVCRKLANHFHCVVVSVDYRLSPENPFPKPLNDCYDATIWAASNIHLLGRKKDHLIVCGESAGGNMAAVVAHMLRNEHSIRLAAQLLLCPVISSSLNIQAFENSMDQYFLTKDAMQFFWSMYLSDKENRQNPYASPELFNDFSKLPPAIIITAEFDPLHIEANDYGDKLRKSGVEVIKKCVPQVIHGFIDLPIYDESQKNSWIKKIGNYLNQILLLKRNTI